MAPAAVDRYGRFPRAPFNHIENTFRARLPLRTTAGRIGALATNSCRQGRARDEFSSSRAHPYDPDPLKGRRAAGAARVHSAEEPGSALFRPLRLAGTLADLRRSAAFRPRPICCAIADRRLLYARAVIG